MIDKKTESDIKAVKSFLEFWVKFHSIYNNTISKELITQEDEIKFLETKDIIKSKYEEVKGDFEFKYMPHMRLTDPVSDILSLSGVRFISEKNMKKAGDNWKDSYVFLNSILERLKNKKRRLEQFNPIGVFFKRTFERTMK
ncbi:MAG: hypothetical protein WC779_04095 [Candidatus Omnitrophota bacterium]|jgi:hypothetical protein